MRGHEADQDYPPGQPDSSERNSRVKMVTKTGLKERGWTEKMIRELAGEPDERRPNTRYPGRADYCLYLLERVEEVERTPAFSKLLKQSNKRKKSGLAAGAKTKAIRLARTTSQVERLEIVLLKLAPYDLLRLACESYNGWVKAEQPERELATAHSDLWLLEYISVRFLRESVAGYQELYASLHKQVGAREGRRRLDERIYQQIAQRYPHLAHMCEHQNKRKLFPTLREQAAREKAAIRRREAKTAKPKTQ